MSTICKKQTTHTKPVSATYYRDILVKQIIYLHMKNSVLLVELNVSTITGAGEKKCYISNKVINNERRNHKMLEQLNLAGRTSI